MSSLVWALDQTKHLPPLATRCLLPQEEEEQRAGLATFCYDDSIVKGKAIPVTGRGGP
jgi:hypothetical protein